MSVRLRVGFVPLVDAAVVVTAKELGFAAAQGIDLELVRQPSWALLRDHLNLGHLDGAQTLAPLPIAAALGLGQVRSDLAVPFVLSRGGNAITVSRSLADELEEHADGHAPRDAAQWGQAMARLVRRRQSPLTLAMVYPFSGHNYELRHWLFRSGIDPDAAVRIVSIPPPLIVDSMKAGQIDGFCVGEPWNSVAVAEGAGRVIATKSELYPGGIEKVLAVRRSMLDPSGPLADLLLALDEAARWCDDGDNREALAAMLARPEYLRVDPCLILPSLCGHLSAGGTGTQDFLYFHRDDACRPTAADAAWLYEQMVRWGQADDASGNRSAALNVFAGDFYARVFGAATPS